MALYFVSWLHCTDNFNPKNNIPSENILCWWSSKYENTSMIMYAYIQAESLEDCYIHLQSEWKYAFYRGFENSIRFCMIVEHIETQKPTPLDSWELQRCKPFFKD